jgi:uncharacterized protein (TIGR03067 family)
LERSKSVDDRQLIQGTWTVIDLQQSANLGADAARTQKEFLKTGACKLTVTRDKIIYSLDKSEMSYRLDPTKAPKVLEVLDDGVVVARAIYELQGNDLKICLGRKPHAGEPAVAPSSFDIKKAAPGTFPTLFVLKCAADRKDRGQQLPQGRGAAPKDLHTEVKESPTGKLLFGDSSKAESSRQQGEVVLPEVETLLKKRLALLRQVADELNKQYQQGTASPSVMLRAKDEVFKAELELARTDKDRVAILEKRLAVAKELETLARKAYQQGGSTHLFLLNAEIYRLEAEIALKRAKAKMSP